MKLLVLDGNSYELLSEWGAIYRNGGRAIKLYPPGTPYRRVAEKARIHSLVYDAGLPVPAVYGAKKIGKNQVALEMDYIESQPFACLNAMAQLQCRINTVEADGFGLPRFSKKIADKIKRTPYLARKIKHSVHDLLSRLDTGKTKLCHGDIHPYNILFDGETHWVIDWDGACTGDPAADACMTYFYEKRFAPDSADQYLDAYCANSGLAREDVLAWLPVIAAYQVNIKTEDERDFILNIINEWYEKS